MTAEDQANRPAGALPAGAPLQLSRLAEYAPGSIVSRALVQSKPGSVTLFAFDTGQGLNEHSTPYDAYILVLEGTASITIGGTPVLARPGEIVRLPASVPHAVEAPEPFKMLLMMIRG